MNYPVAFPFASSVISPFEIDFQNQDEAFVPAIVHRMMACGAKLVLSLSAGKDSDVMLRKVMASAKKYGWQKDQIICVFAELGRIEWLGVQEHLNALCKEFDLSLLVVRRKKGGMVDRWRERFEKIASEGNDKPFWSSALARYCTDQLKNVPIDQALRLINTWVKQGIVPAKVGDKPFFSSSASRYCTKELKIQVIDQDALRSFDLVICGIGIRAEESPKRSQKPFYQVRSAITTAALKEPKLEKPEQKEAWADDSFDRWLLGNRKGRFAIDWHPILHFKLEDVWRSLGTSSEDVDRRRDLFRMGWFAEALKGFQGHWGYIAESSRLSCSQCVLASLNDLKVGALFNPLVWLELALLELESGWSFKNNWWLCTLRNHVRQHTQSFRNKLLKVLYDMGLVDRFAPGFSLAVMTMVPAEISMYWTDEFFAEITSDRWWAEADEESDDA